MNKIKRMKEIIKASPNFGKGVSYKMCVVDEFHDMKELLEENAKLKEEIKYLSEQIQKLKIELDTPESVVLDKLNKAKKIISNLYAICKDNHYPNTSVLMEQAEQFLKEE